MVLRISRGDLIDQLVKKYLKNEYGSRHFIKYIILNNNFSELSDIIWNFTERYSVVNYEDIFNPLYRNRVVYSLTDNDTGYNSALVDLNNLNNTETYSLDSILELKCSLKEFTAFDILNIGYENISKFLELESYTDSDKENESFDFRHLVDLLECKYATANRYKYIADELYKDFDIISISSLYNVNEPLALLKRRV